MLHWIKKEHCRLGNSSHFHSTLVWCIFFSKIKTAHTVFPNWETYLWENTLFGITLSETTEHRHKCLPITGCLPNHLTSPPSLQSKCYKDNLTTSQRDESIVRSFVTHTLFQYSYWHVETFRDHCSLHDFIQFTFTMYPDLPILILSNYYLFLSYSDPYQPLSLEYLVSSSATSIDLIL